MIKEELQKMNLLNGKYFELDCCGNSQCFDLKKCLNLKIFNIEKYDTRDKITIGLENNKYLLVKIKKNGDIQCLEEIAKIIERDYIKKTLNKDLLERDFCSAERIN